MSRKRWWKAYEIVFVSQTNEKINLGLSVRYPCGDAPRAVILSAVELLLARQQKRKAKPMWDPARRDEERIKGIINKIVSDLFREIPIWRAKSPSGFGFASLRSG